MSILGFYLCKNYEFWFSLSNCYITECLYEYGMSIFFQVHVTNLQDQQRSLIMVTFLALFVQSVPILLTIPMDYHLHGSRAMRGLATLSVPSMPNTTHETERGKWQDAERHSRDYPVLYSLIPLLSFFRRLLLCAFHSGRLPNKPVCECVQGWKGLKYWRKQRADMHRMQEKGQTKPHFCCHNYV